MSKIILITGATDGIGRVTAEALAKEGHHVLIHGRNAEKLAAVAEQLRTNGATVETFKADFSDLAEVAKMAQDVLSAHKNLDVLINNAGVFKTRQPLTNDGLDVRFVVNSFAPALLTRLLMPIMSKEARVVHLSSAAQATVDLRGMSGERRLDDMEAYAQSKLALTMWSQSFAAENPQSLVSIAVNPGSLLATKMVQEGFGMAGNNIEIGADILVRAALSKEFSDATGLYFDNDSRCFALPLEDANRNEIIRSIEATILHFMEDGPS